MLRVLFARRAPAQSVRAHVQRHHPLSPWGLVTRGLSTNLPSGRVPRVVDIPTTGLTDHLFREFKKFPSDVAMVDGPSGRSVDFGTLEHRVRVAASGLLRQGFGNDKTLLVLLPNCIEYFVAFHAASKAGGVVSTANPLYHARELAHQLRDSGATHMLTHTMFRPLLEQVETDIGTDNMPVVNYVGEEGCFLSGEDQPPAADSTLPVVNGDDLLVLPYSSGTTGLPKGVMLTNHNIVSNIAQIVDHDEVNLGIERGDVVLGVLPFFHIYGMTVVLNAALKVGATVVTMPKFDPELFLKVIQDHRVTFAPLVPPIALFLAKHPLVDSYDVSSLHTIFCGAAPLDKTLQQQVVERLGNVSVRQGYGMTEMSPVSHLVPKLTQEASLTVAGSIGVKIPNTEAKLVNGHGEEVPVGEHGELWCRGPQVMKSYLNNEEATKNTLTSDGWIKTGDIAYEDENGYLFIVDRLKELIKVKGFQVAPAELEGLLLSHPGVLDACVVPVHDEETGERPKAFVVRKSEGEQVSADELKDFLKDLVAEYKQVHYIDFVDSIPKSASGKLLRKELRGKH